jgi:hypothetical protein
MLGVVYIRPDLGILRMNMFNSPPPRVTANSDTYGIAKGPTIDKIAHDILRWFENWCAGRNIKLDGEANALDWNVASLDVRISK